VKNLARQGKAELGCSHPTATLGRDTTGWRGLTGYKRLTAL